MIKYNIHDMERSEWEKIFEEKIKDSIRGIQMSGHAKELHYGQTDKSIAERVINEGKANISSFYEESDMDKYVMKTMSAFKDKISEWMADEKMTDDLVLRFTNASDIPIGFGFNSDLEEIVTKDVKVVLSKFDEGQKSDFGFFVKTAYADIESKDALKNGRAWKTGYQYRTDSRQHEENDLQKEQSQSENREKQKETDFDKDKKQNQPGGIIGIFQKAANLLSSIPKFLHDALSSLAEGFGYVFPNFGHPENVLESYGIPVSKQQAGMAEFDDSWLEKDDSVQQKQEDYVWKDSTQNDDILKHDMDEIANAIPDDPIRRHETAEFDSASNEPFSHETIESFAADHMNAEFLINFAETAEAGDEYEITSHIEKEFSKFCKDAFPDITVGIHTNIEFLPDSVSIDAEVVYQGEHFLIHKDLNDRESELFENSVYETAQNIHESEIKSFLDSSSEYVSYFMKHNIPAPFDHMETFLNMCMNTHLQNNLSETAALYLNANGDPCICVLSGENRFSFKMDIPKEISKELKDWYEDELKLNTEELYYKIAEARDYESLDEDINYAEQEEDAEL